MEESAPRVNRKRVAIAKALAAGRGLVGGYLYSDERGWFLRDSSGELPLPAALVESHGWQAPGWLALELTGASFLPRHFRAVQPNPYLDLAAVSPTRREHLIRRWQIHQAIRRFFLDADFLETDTPVKVMCPGMEPYLDTFAAADEFLRTSPELHMKRLLAAGFDRIFQMGPCFRAGDRGSIHREEFLMLEWYRAFATLEDLIDDLTRLLWHLSPLADEPTYFQQLPALVTCAQLFESKLGVRLRDHENREPLWAAAKNHGVHFDASDDWDTLYFRLFLNKIEPDLGKDRPTLVTHYPASQSALARLAPAVPGEMPSCLRFELYIRGIEIANAFDELTDPGEQRLRFQQDAALRAALHKPVYPMDQAFLGALEAGLPPSAGIALGVDRLVMTLLGARRLDDVLPFS